MSLFLINTTIGNITFYSQHTTGQDVVTDEDLCSRIQWCYSQHLIPREIIDDNDKIEVDNTIAKCVEN